MTRDEEFGLWKNWKKDKDELKLLQLIESYQPLVHHTVSKFRTSGLPGSALQAEGNKLLIKSLESYSPDRGAALNTHIHNNLRNIQRYVYDHRQAGHIPEARNLKRSTFLTVRSNLEDRFGREPHIDEMADEMDWSVGETERMSKEVRGELLTSKIEGSDLYGMRTSAPRRDVETARYMYEGMPAGQEKEIMAHTFGFDNKPILSNIELARKMNTNPMAITRAKQKIATQFKGFL